MLGAGKVDLVAYLAEKGDVSRVRRELAANPVIVNQLDSRGYSALMMAARKNRTDMIRLLIGMGADPGLPSTAEGHYTALMIAIIQQQDEAARVLAEATRDPNVQDQFGRTALHYAADFGKKQIIDILLSKSADPNLEDHDRKSATMVAKLETQRDAEAALEQAGGIVESNRFSQEKLKADIVERLKETL